MAISKITAIIGAGMAGELLLKELKFFKYENYKVIGFIDDDQNKIGEKIKSIQVLGSTHQISELTEKYRIELFIIAIPSAPGVTIQRIVKEIQKTKADFMIVPPLFQNLEINKISYPRKVDINDLIHRPIVNVLDKNSIKNLNNAVILITGVAGSIGSELCMQLASCNPNKIIGIDFSETQLFYITNDISQRFPNLNFIPELINIQDKEKLKKIFAKYSPEFVYHAAAYKHVGLMELFPHECVENNIIGSINVINEAIANSVKKFVFISTDKAVNPISTMGASKRIIEKYLLSLNKSSVKFIIVRFGNVLESNGSAINIFKRQIESRESITLTDKNMERYFMTIIEAAQLVIQASILGEGGELFVLEMGHPYKIIDIINKLIELSGYNKNSISVKIIGKKDGEKLREELFFDFEKPQKSKHERILVCKTDLFRKKDKYKEDIEVFIEEYYNFTKNDLKGKIFEFI